MCVKGSYGMHITYLQTRSDFDILNQPWSQTVVLQFCSLLEQSCRIGIDCKICG